MGCKGSQVQILSPRPNSLPLVQPGESGYLGTATLEERIRISASLFLEQYKLESNPFAAGAARPVFASHAMRYALLKLDELANRQIQSLCLSGPAGVGKTALVRQRLRQLKDLTISWIKPSCETREQLLAQLLEEIGPGPVEGSASELRHILEVFLRHQAGNGRTAFIVADGLERFAGPVLRELEGL